MLARSKGHGTLRRYLHRARNLGFAWQAARCRGRFRPVRRSAASPLASTPRRRTGDHCRHGAGGRRRARDRGAHGRHAARAAGEEDRVDRGGRRPAAAMQSLAVRTSRSIRVRWRGRNRRGSPCAASPASMKSSGRPQLSLCAQRDLGVLDGEGEAMAEALARAPSAAARPSPARAPRACSWATSRSFL